MAPVRDLGPRGVVLGVADGPATGNVNPYLPGSGWDVIFDPTVMPNVTEFELYHISLDGPVGSFITVLRDGKEWDYAAGWSNGWDPSQPLPLQQTSTVQICWNVAFTAGPYNRTSNIRPRATLWLRLPLERVL